MNPFSPTSYGIYPHFTRGELGLRQASYCVQVSQSQRDTGGVQTQAATLLLAPKTTDWASWKPQIPSHQLSPQVYHALIF